MRGEEAARIALCFSERAPQRVPGEKDSEEDSRDPLSTCPAQKRSRYRRSAERSRRERGEAIRLKCLDCCAWDTREVKRCEIRDCPLWPFRPYQERR